MSPRTALIFDVDNTLTPPRQLLGQRNAEMLLSLDVPFYLAAGSDYKLVSWQFFEPLHAFGFRGSLDAFLCNGALRYRVDFADALTQQLTRDFSLASHLGAGVMAKIDALVADLIHSEAFRLPPPMEIIGERVVNRGSMINISPIGRPNCTLNEAAYCNRDRFVAYDKQTGFRQTILASLRRQIANIEGAEDLDVSYGGQTSFDIVVKGNDKGFAVTSLLAEGYERLVYIGDALFEGGNDEAILKFIDRWPDASCPVECIKVDNCEMTANEVRALGFC